MVRRLFGNVITFGIIWIVPIAGEGFSKDRVERLLDAAAIYQHIFISLSNGVILVRRSNVPTTQIEFHYRHKSLDGVIDRRHGK